MSGNDKEIFEYIDEDRDRVRVKEFPEFLIVASHDFHADEDEDDVCVRLRRAQVQDLYEALGGWLDVTEPEGDKEAPEPEPVKLAPIPPERIRAAVLHLLMNDTGVFREVANAVIGALKHSPDARDEVRDIARNVFRHMFNLANNEIQGGDTQR